MNDPALPMVEAAEIRPAWLAQHVEAPLAPDLPIIDAHHHLSDFLWGGYREADLLADIASGHRIEATVFVQCGYSYRKNGPAELRPIGETEGAAAVARHAEVSGSATRLCAAIVSAADLLLGDAVAPVLDAHIEAGEGRFRGIRQSAARHPAFNHGVAARPPAELYLNPQLRTGFRHLRERDLSFEAWMFHNQLPELEDLASQFPDTRIVLNHIGAPLGVGPYEGHRDTAWSEWRTSMSRLRELDNISVKLGALGMSLFGFDFHTRATPPTSEQLADAWGPYIFETIELFGPSRCMFESNFPVDKGTTSYGVLWNAFKRIAARFSGTEQRQLFRDTAASFYRI